MDYHDRLKKISGILEKGGLIVENPDHDQQCSEGIKWIFTGTGKEKVQIGCIRPSTEVGKISVDFVW